MVTHRQMAALCAGGLIAFTAIGCARPQPTQEQVVGLHGPGGLGLGPTPPGGPSEASTGAGAGGSGAGGFEVGRVGSTHDDPAVPPQPVGIDTSRMSPVASDGSGTGDRGNPIPPTVPLVVPPKTSRH